MQQTYFNQTPIIWPRSWVENPQKLKKTFQTEAGTDVDLIIRENKLTVSASYKCTDTWVQTFMNFRDMNSFTLKTYDVKTKTYKENTVRMTDFNYGFVPKSNDLEVTNGIWEVSFNLEEF